MFLALGLALIGIGFVRIFLLDVAWEFTKLSNEIKGRTPQRTRSWEGASVVSGIIVIIIGLILSCHGVDEIMKERERDKQVSIGQPQTFDSLSIIRDTDGKPITLDKAVMAPYVEAGTESTSEHQVVTFIDSIHARGFYSVPITQTADSTSQAIMDYYQSRPILSHCSTSVTILACKAQYGAFYLTLAEQSTSEVLVEWNLTIE